MEYLSPRQTEEKWGLSIRRAQTLCNTDRISVAAKSGPYWAISIDAEKPKDERIKTGRYIKRRELKKHQTKEEDCENWI